VQKIDQFFQLKATEHAERQLEEIRAGRAGTVTLDAVKQSLGLED
jgi:hypothetical protein